MRKKTEKTKFNKGFLLMLTAKEHELLFFLADRDSISANALVRSLIKDKFKDEFKNY